MTARECALRILYDIEKEEAYSNLSLKARLGKTELTKADRALVTELVYGVTSRKITLDYIIGKYSKIKLKKISVWIKNILRMGIYQILYLEKIPDSAAVNEAVKLAKRFGHQGSSGFVNGVLHSVARGGEPEFPDKDRDFVKYLSVKYSASEWICDYFAKKLGKTESEAFFESMLERPQLSARVNTLKCDATTLIAELEKEGISACEGVLSEEIVLSGTGDLAQSESFCAGRFYIQDRSAMLTCHISGAKAGMKVIDTCAAPGGKSTHIAEMMENKGTVISCDVFEHKLKLIEDNAKRLGIDIIKTVLNDATKVIDEHKGTCDIVLCDVPCMGFGILRRKSEIKTTQTPEDLGEIVKLQKQILRSGAEYVKEGGLLIYSTCSLTDEENVNQVREFLAENSEFSPEDFSDRLPEGYSCTGDGYIELYPHKNDGDGFFIACMRKKV